MGKNDCLPPDTRFCLPPWAKHQLEMTVFIILQSMEMDHFLIETPIRADNRTEKLASIFLYSTQTQICVCLCMCTHLCFTILLEQTQTPIC